MSVPPDYMSQLMQGGLMGPQGGLMGGLMSDPNALLGLNLLAQSNQPGRFGSLFGQAALNTQKGMLDTQNQKLDIASRYLQLQQQMAQQQALQEYANGLGQRGQPGQAAPQGAQQPPQMAQGGPQMGAPQGSVQTQQQPSLFSAASDIANTPVNGMSPDTYRRLGVAMRKDPLTIEKELRTAQVAAAQDQVKPQLDALETIMQADSPSQAVKADPQALSIWQAAAPRLGLNPVSDFNDKNVRNALSYAYNQAAARVNLPPTTHKPPLKTVTLPDGRQAQIDPTTGKEEVLPASPLVKVVGNDGKPVFVPEGKAAGMRPYNEMTAASDDALQATAEDVANYKLAPPSGARLLSGNWPEVMKIVKSINPDYDATQFTTKNKARQSFATGRQGDIVRSLSVATDHLDQLSKAVDELKNGGVPAANKVANFFSQQTGNPAVNNFDAMKEIVGDEVVKAVVGATGASADREAIKKTFSAANSPQQLYGVIAKYKGLMGGQLKGLRQQYERTTGLKDFDNAISDNARQELTPSTVSSTAHPADIQALLNKYK